MDRAEEPNLIVTDLHRRVTGVGTTIRTLVPLINEQEPLALVATMPHGSATRYGLWKALRLCRRAPRNRPFRIWHARRNNEMLWGLIFKHLLGCRLKLVMTSAAIRRHSWFPRRLAARMDAIIATSEQAASFVDNVVATIPHGVDCHRFRPPENRADAWARWDLPGKFGVGIVGRIRPEKGTDLFVDAMIRVLPKYPDFTACIAGRATADHASFQQSLNQKIVAAGLANRIRWMGEIPFDRMPAFHQAMSLCVAPARYEGFGLVPLEAMACGVPVVASCTGSYRQMIRDGESGVLVPTGGLSALTSALDQMMADPDRLAAMADGCRQTVESRFSAQLEARQILSVYEKLWSEAA
jgi:mannosyltransferase